MKVAIETMVHMLFLCAGCILLVQIVGSNLYILQARTCFHKLADQIECSQSDEAVIAECKKEAGNCGYRLECERMDVPQGDSCVLLSLYYELKVPVIGKSQEEEKREGVIQGYAR